MKTFNSAQEFEDYALLVLNRALKLLYKNKNIDLHISDYQIKEYDTTDNRFYINITLDGQIHMDCGFWESWFSDDGKSDFVTDGVTDPKQLMALRQKLPEEDFVVLLVAIRIWYLGKTYYKL